MSALPRRLRGLGRALTAGLAPTLVGCMNSYGLLQTAHTTPPGRLRAHLGGSNIQNSIDGQAGRDIRTNSSVEAGVRLGVTRFMDLGVVPLLNSGAALDTKVNVLDPEGRFALAPRGLVGFSAAEDHPAFVGELGLIGSYRFFDRLEPYAALGFANHWLFSEAKPSEPLSRDQRLADSTGSGDGLFKTSLGLAGRVSGNLWLYGEYSHWFVAQNDPGNGYAFLPSNVFALGMSL